MDPHPGRIDPFSMALIILTLLPFTYAIKSAASAPWFVTVGALALAIVSGVGFVRRQLGQSTPMLDVRLFANARFSGSLMVNFFGIFSLVGFIYFVSQHLQLIAGYSPLHSGLLMTPGLVLSMLFSLASVPLSQRFGSPNIMVVGLWCSAAAYAVVVFSAGGAQVFLLMAAFCILGIGIGMTETLSNDMTLAAVPAAKAGAASAISETAYEIGAVLGTAVLGTILNTVYSLKLVVPVEASQAQAEQAGQTLSAAHLLAEQLDPNAASSLLASAAQAFDQGVVITAGIASVLSLIASVVVLRFIKPTTR